MEVVKNSENIGAIWNDKYEAWETTVDGKPIGDYAAAKTVGEWVGIGKGEAKPYTLKINGEEKTVKPVNSEVVNGFYSPLEKTINETKFDKLPAKQWIEKFARGEEAKWTGLNEWLSKQQGARIVTGKQIGRAHV